MTNDAGAETPFTQEEIESIFDQFGGAEAMREGLRKFEDACIRLNDEYDSLLERFPNKWVAMNHEGTVFVGDTLEGLFAEFESQGVSREGFNIEFLDPDPGILLL